MLAGEKDVMVEKAYFAHGLGTAADQRGGPNLNTWHLSFFALGGKSEGGKERRDQVLQRILGYNIPRQLDCPFAVLACSY